MTQLSIIVTSYNIEKYIEQCLASVIGQTLTDVEIIVVDDGSSDSTPDIIERFAAEDDRIVPVLLRTNTPGGVATAANTGLDLATGRYVGFVDGDDYCEPTMFARLLDAAADHDADLAMCRYRLVSDADGTATEPADAGLWSELDRQVYPLDVDERRRFLRFVAVPWRKIYRREMLELERIRFPVGDYFYEDNPFHWFSILSAESVAVVPEVLCYHRVHRHGQTMQTADERLFRIFIHHDTIRQWLDERGMTRDYAPSLVGWAISQMEWIAPRTPKALRAELFRTVRRVIVQYDDGTVEESLKQGRKGQLARVLADALRQDNFAAFAKALETGPATSNPAVSAWYHLRYSGVTETARLTGRYLSNKTSDVAMRLRERRASAHHTSHDDLMFALVVLDRRLARLEDEVRAMADRY